MVGCNSNHRVLIQPMLPQHLDKTPHNRIGIGNLSVIKSGSVMRLEWLRRIIRIVRIIKVEPDKERPLLMTAEPSQRAIGNILSPTFNTLVAVLSGLALVKVGVIHVKTTFETGGRRRRIEDIGSDKCRCVIPVSY